ncbi:MAG: methyl-accepting chemotaxis protein [Anaerolineales bacterium]|jgi:methyl-accepting chemotaxis protein
MLRLFRVRDWPIAVKLITVMVLIGTVPMALATHFNTSETGQSLTKQIGESMASVTDSEASEVSAWLTQNINMLQVIAHGDTAINYVEQANGSYSGSETQILTEIQATDSAWRAAAITDLLIRNVITNNGLVNPLSSALHEFSRQFSGHIRVMVTDRYGALVAATERIPDYFQADEDWWREAWNEGEGGIYIGGPAVDQTNGLTVFYIALPVLNEQSQPIGVIHTTLHAKPIIDLIAASQVSGGGQGGLEGRSALVDSDGRVIIDAEQSHLGTSMASLLAQSEVEGAEDAEGPTWQEIANPVECSQCHESVGAPLIVGVAQPGTGRSSNSVIANLGWRVVQTITSEEALAPVAESQQLSFILMGGAGLVAVVMATVLTRGLTAQIRNIMNLFSRVGMGEFDARVEVTSQDEFGRMSESLNAMLDNTLALIETREDRDAMQASIMKLLDEVSGLADGDLTVEAEVTADVTGAIADSFNMMIQQLRTIINDVQDATLRVSSSAVEIRDTAEELSHGSEDQASKITATSLAIEEMAASIHQVSESANVSAKVGEQALASAQQGVIAVQNTMEGMNRIRDQVQETAKRIKRLGESSQEIGDIVQLIGDIADRTSILALNASIQASMAGDAGQGFAVVAEEVERLAERSTEATKQIDTLIRTIQNEMNEAVSAMESTTNEVVEGSMLAEEAGQALSQIGTVSDQLTELIQSISKASQEQASSSEDLARSMVEIAGVTQQTASGTKQAADLINNLAALAEGLRASVSTFRLPSSNGDEPEEHSEELAGSNGDLAEEKVVELAE